jgi:hypothetical protein
MEDGKTETFHTSGQLYLRVNDERPEDGDGAWTIRLTLDGREASFRGHRVRTLPP